MDARRPRFVRRPSGDPDSDDTTLFIHTCASTGLGRDTTGDLARVREHRQLVPEYRTGILMNDRRHPAIWLAPGFLG